MNRPARQAMEPMTVEMESVQDAAFALGGDGVCAGEFEGEVVGVDVVGRCGDGGGDLAAEVHVAGRVGARDTDEQTSAVGGEIGVAVLISLEGARGGEALLDKFVEPEGILQEGFGDAPAAGPGAASMASSRRSCSAISSRVRRRLADSKSASLQ